jgi:hypothetical protein
VSSIVVFVIQYSHTISIIDGLKRGLLGVTVSTGIGSWVELAGGVLTLVGGIYAVRLSKLPPTSPAEPASFTSVEETRARHSSSR